MASIGGSRLAVLPVTAALLVSCGRPVPELPADHIEAAATCYAARVALMKNGTMTAEEANEAAQFLLLGAINDGLASPTVLKQAAARGNELRDKGEHKDNAADYTEPCAKRFPATAADSFKGLPADSRDTRMMCLTLSTSVLQIYQSSRVTPPAPSVAMNEKLDTSLMAEINAAGPVNPAEIAGQAMRSMAKAAELGPVTQVMKACADRYAPS